MGVCVCGGGGGEVHARVCVHSSRRVFNRSVEVNVHAECMNYSA